MCLKTKRIYARVTEDEMKIIEKKIEKGGYKNLSEYARDKVLNKKIIKFDLGDAIERLALLGERLNHIVILCHQGMIDTVDLSSFLVEIRHMHELISEAKAIEIEDD